MFCDFIFDGESLKDKGYMVCAFSDESSETIDNSQIKFAEIKSPVSDISHKVATSYDNNLTKTIGITKINCSDGKYTMTVDEVTALTKWLCRKNYKWFKWVSDDDTDDIMHEVKMDTSVQIFNGEIIGLNITITSNRPYGVTPEIKYELDFSTSPEYKCRTFSDDEGYIYPDVKITCVSGGDIELLNDTENRKTVIKNCIAGEVITIDGNDILQISSTNPNHVYSKDFNYIYPRLFVEYGSGYNMISCNSDCLVEMKYRGARKAGL